MGRSVDECKAPDMPELLRRAGVDSRHVGVELGQGDEAYADLLFHLTRLRFAPEEARCFWGEIVLHMQGLSLALGRDVGLHVAMCDYFLNLHPKMREPVLVEVQLLLQKEKGALVDELTGLYNRRYFNDTIHREVERFKRFGQLFSLIMLDVDRFKPLNDTYGHVAGDEALKAVAKALHDTARDIDHVVRFGGDEFVLILPHTDCDPAVEVAERLRRTVEKLRVPVGNKLVTLTVSQGVACFPGDANTARELLHRADQALLEAKRVRNSVFSYTGRIGEPSRAPLDLTLQCDCPGQGPVAVKVLSVSSCGVLCQSDTAILPGTRVEIVVPGDKPGSSGLRLGCSVVRLEREAKGGQYEITMPLDVAGEKERQALERLVELEKGPDV